MTKLKSTTTNKRKNRIRAKLKRYSQRLRLSVFRSNRNIYAQIIDDAKGKTLASASETDLDSKSKQGKSKLDIAKLVGEVLAKKAKKKQLSKVTFDRGSSKYHGRIKALAQGAREQGLNF